MSYQITIVNTETSKTIEVEASAEEVLAILFGKEEAEQKKPRATLPRKASGKRGRPRKEEIVDGNEEPQIDGATPKKGEEIRRLLKQSDATPAEIAQRVGCSTTYVHMVRNAMERDGKL